MFAGLSVYHRFVLPRPANDRPGGAGSPAQFLENFFATFAGFFKKPRITLPLLFLLVYRLGEAQLVKMVQPFLLDPRAQGGLGLDNNQLGLIYGTAGVAAPAPVPYNIT